MSDDHLPDEARAELEYLRLGAADAKARLRVAEEGLGVTVTDANIGQLLDTMVADLRRTGNEALAAKYSAAFQQCQATVARLNQLVRDGAEKTEIKDARQTMDAAGEDFDRVLAETRAWFDKLKGGA